MKINSIKDYSFRVLFIICSIVILNSCKQHEEPYYAAKEYCECMNKSVDVDFDSRSDICFDKITDKYVLLKISNFYFTRNEIEFRKFNLTADSLEKAIFFYERYAFYINDPESPLYDANLHP